LVGRGWLNTGGRQIHLGDLRGRFLLLDFWAFCCVNCLHVLDELRPLEAELSAELVVVGVHSPKFEHEADAVALRAAIERYGVEHPVLDDPELVTWRAYTVQAWPTLVLVDPEGYVVAQYAGEGHVHAIRALLAELIPRYRERGTLQPGRSPYVPVECPDSPLRFPAKAVGLESSGFLVADAGHHSVVQVDLDGERVVRRFGSGDRGLLDGSAEEARFHEPNGLCVLPDAVAEAVGYDVLVADTANHALRGLDRESGRVVTVAGSGRQWMQGDGTDALSSPWDVTWWRGRAWIAMAGIHQLWSFDPHTRELRVEAGTTQEGLLDGPAARAWLAQPSGLAADGERLWIADAEVSALRWLDDTGVQTAVGQGLFDFGFRDGDATQALLQHPLGVAVLPDGSVAVADTYNSAVRRFDPATGVLTTLASGLAEVSGLVVRADRIWAVVSAEHRLVELPSTPAAAASGFATTTQREPMALNGAVELEVGFVPPPGQKLDERFGPASQLTVTATPPALISAGDGTDTALTRSLRLDPTVGSGVLHISARAASCDVATGPGAACRMHQQDWGVPVIVSDEGAARLELPLGGAVPDAVD
jgi:thiol-disulfide isomerase/thioredoxin